MLPLEHSTIPSTFIKLTFQLRSLFCLFLSGRLRQILLYSSEKLIINTITNEPAHKILILMAYAQSHSLNMNAQLASRAIGFKVWSQP